MPLAQGADAEAEDHCGQTPLSLATARDGEVGISPAVPPYFETRGNLHSIY